MEIEATLVRDHFSWCPHLLLAMILSSVSRQLQRSFFIGITLAFDWLCAFLQFMSASIVPNLQNHGTAIIGDEKSKLKRNGSKKERSPGQNGQAKRGPRKAVCAALNVTDWDYDEHGTCGPKHWLKIADCEHLGDRQSPIDLQLSKMRILPLNSHPLCLVNYKKPLSGQLVNTGCGIQFRPNPQVEPPEIYGGLLDQNYRFIQYHFHWAQNDNEGSEHTIGGLRYPAELHLVHQGVKDPCKLAVLGIFLKLDNGTENGEPRKFVFDSEEMGALRKVVEFEQNTTFDTKHCLASKLPPNCCREVATYAEHFVSSFVRYEGSLTTPPCSENVIWTVFTDPLLITREQLSLLRAIKDCRGNVIAKNYRPVQNCSNREVFLMAATDVASKN